MLARILDGGAHLARRAPVGDEQHEQAQVRHVGERGAEPPAEHPAGDREQHAGAVTGLLVGRERATMTELRQALQPELHHSAVGSTRDVGHESDPARVPLECPVGPGTSARSEPSVGRRHGSPPRSRSERPPYASGISPSFRVDERCVTKRDVPVEARRVTQPLRAGHRHETASPYAGGTGSAALSTVVG